MINFIKIIALFIATIAGNASAQSFSETSLAFRKFDAKISAGINYIHYTEAIADIIFATSEYEINANESNKVNIEGFKSALMKYRKAGSAWELYLNVTKNELGDKYFIDTIAPDYCPNANLNSTIDPLIKLTINKCINSLWTEATVILKDLHEVLQIEKSEKSNTKK